MSVSILVVGNGGREHALAWKLAQSPQLPRLFIAPGNAGTALVGQNVPIETTEEIVSWCRTNPVDLVVIGADSFLADGLTDALRLIGIPVFGPTRAAAEIEWSKSFAKHFMREEGIPTASAATFSDFEVARQYLKRQPLPVVIKADGLAFGKGVVIARTLIEAEDALTTMMKSASFGSAGKQVVIEEFLEGREFSVHAFCDGEDAVLFPASQDHKRIFDNDNGPNTGGMGTIAPVPWVENDLLREIRERIVLPCIRGLKKRGRPFVGVLYPGIMVTADGPKVIEFNARFGDPETQSYMRILQTDLVDIMHACINGTLPNMDISWSVEAACCVVLASGGYPGVYEKGKSIFGLEKKHNGVEIFYAGAKNSHDAVVTDGGRVLGVTATDVNLPKALERAYEAAKDISFEGMQFRRDIGAKSIVGV